MKPTPSSRIAARLFAALAFALFTALCVCTPARAAVQTYGTLLAYDFDTTAWTGATPEAVGTIDVLGSAQPSLGLRSASLIASGPLPLSITETNLGKLTLAFSLSASAAKPVTVTIESYDASQNRTGGLQTLIYPAAPDFYQRYAVDLSTCTPSGAGTFQPNAPYVSFSFSVGGTAWQGVANPEIRVDNVNYALPAYYVSTTGSNYNTGRSEAQAFLTPQKGLDLAQAGDIVVVMDGTYISPYGPRTSPPAEGGTSPVASFPRAGTPVSWIVLKNYPGQMPTFFSNAWNIVNLSHGYNGSPSDVPLAYIEVRGIHIRGQGDVVAQKYPDSIGQADSRSNSNGISVDGRYMTVLPHHIRLADNFVEYCPGGGIGVGEADWMTTEGNICRNNCWTTIYAPSGISYLSDFNYDATVNVYKRLVRNNVCYGNQTFVPWRATGKISDGNGIIMDVNQGTDTHPDWFYMGRTLVQSNLCFNNGGSGIHSFKANRVDIVNNTAYLNSASPELQYGQIFAGYADDVRISNNILLAPVANTAAGEKPEPVNANYNTTNVVYSNNLYFGGNTAPIKGAGDVIGDPQFIRPSRDGSVADFHLLSTSPARAAGVVQPYSPFLDLDGTLRGATPDKGVYEFIPTPPAPVGLSPASTPEGGPAFTLTVNGTGFMVNSLVKWNGVTQPTTFVSATQLTAAIPASLVKTAGTAAITVTTPKVATSPALTFTVTPAVVKPNVTSLSPASRTAGSGAFTLTVTGTGFAAESLVKWNGVTQPTTFVSATQLTAAIPASLVKTAGTASITVTTPHVSTSGSLTLTINP